MHAGAGEGGSRFSKTVKMRALQRALEMQHGEHALARHLHAPVISIRAFLNGDAEIPDEMFLRLVDFFEGVATNAAADEHHRLELARLRVRTVHGQRTFTAGHDRTSVDAFLRSDLSRACAERVFSLALQAAVNETHAIRGNIQLVEGHGLRLVAQLGFHSEFLDYFSVVTSETPASCGKAHEEMRRVIVSDVAYDPIFHGTFAARIMDNAGARACQSTPLLDESGKLIGMFNTHYARPHCPTPAELDVVDRVARATAAWLNGR